MANLLIINGSVRQGGTGGPIGEWVKNAAVADGRFNVDYANLAEVKLPLMDEPNHPRMRQYIGQDAKDWSKRVDAADAVILVFPEYNHSYSAPIKNALDYLSNEWARKPVGMVNWGGNSGGTRAQAALRPSLTALAMVPTRGNVEINNPWGQVSEGVFIPNQQQEDVLGLQFDELQELSGVLAPLQS